MLSYELKSFNSKLKIHNSKLCDRREQKLPRIAALPGDGIGPEVTAQGMRVLKLLTAKSKKRWTFEQIPLGASYYLKTGRVLPESFLEKLGWFDAIFLGAVGHPKVPAGVLEKGLLLALRFYFDQYVNLRPVKLLDISLCPLKSVMDVKQVNFVVVRENTESMYAGVGGVFKKDTESEIAVQEDINTYKGVSRILDFAFRLARKRRKKLVMSDKSNVLTYGHDLWQRLFKKKCKEFSDIQARHLYIDALCMEIVRDPSQFDVIVTNNLFGDIVTDLGAQIQGGIGVAASGNINPQGVSMFEPVHGSAPNLAGKNLANPVAAILTAGMILGHFGMKKESELVELACREAVRSGKTTPDLGGNLGTKEAGDFVMEHLRNHYVMIT